MPDLIRPAIFEDLPGGVAGFSTRAGGVSEGPYASLNLGLSTEDAEANVRENRRRLFAAVGFAPAQAAIAGQVHGDRIKTVTQPGLFPGYDSLVTAERGVLLCIGAADCAAVLLADAEAGLVGACHAGWRGAAAGLPEKTVEKLQEMGAAAKRLRAYVSPCIGAERFEVGEEVAAQFDAPFVVRDARWAKPHVDLKAAIAAQLRSAGLDPARVEVSPRCTMTETDAFFSYRAAGGTTGRMMGVIGRWEGRKVRG